MTSLEGGLPPDISAALVKGIGAYLRHSPQLDLPPKLRRFKGFTDKSLLRHGPELLAVLEDDAQRSLILQWLEDGKPAVSKDIAAVLEIAARRDDDWEQELKARSRSSADPTRGVSGTQESDSTKALERERAKTAKAKDELRRVREESAARIKELEAKGAASARAVAENAALLAGETKRADDAERRAAQAEQRADREVRRARKDADTAEKQMTRLKEEASALRREKDALKSELKRLTAATKAPRKTTKKPASLPKGPRKPLKVPKGRFEDAPETLEGWLGAPNVHLVVDGYNVTKAKGGYGDLELSAQRERLIDEVMKLMRRHRTRATIVFDGSEVVPGTTRATRGSVKVEYSAGGEIADDHIVALLERLPAHPVILVTNDRELQARARATGATIATSPQLLSLLH